MPLIDDDRVLDGLRNLDQQAIGAIYDQYFSEIYRYVLYRIGDPTLAEDIASDVFVRLLEAARPGHWKPRPASHPPRPGSAPPGPDRLRKSDPRH